ncbi:MAG: spermidine synthase [Phycisphaerales bacterium]
MLLLYTAAVFLSASLLFLVQPMAAKMLVPMLGGSPAVWNTSMVFFQGVLLAGYLYAHLVTRHLAPRRQVIVHACVVFAPLLIVTLLGRLPVLDPRGFPPPGDATPTLWLLGALALAVGGPFFVLSTTGPLLQRWFSSTTHRHAKDPYFLYAASNVGSMLALLGYPFVMEASLPLLGQRRWFAAGFWVFAALVTWCGVLMLRARRDGAGSGTPLSRQMRRQMKYEARGTADTPAAEEADAPLAPLSWWTRVRWVLLAAVPSSLMLGVTQHVSSDIASVPLLWVIPLAIYLLTFILAFSGRGVQLQWTSRVFGVVAVFVAVSLLARMGRPAAAIIGAHFFGMFLAGLVCHGRLAAERPDPRRLTEFFLLIAVGGVLGGAFNALLAPVIFNSIGEYPIAITAACLLCVPSFGDRPIPADNALTRMIAARECAYAVIASLAFALVFAWALTGGAGNQFGFWIAFGLSGGGLLAYAMWRGVRRPAVHDLFIPIAILLYLAALHAFFWHAWAPGQWMARVIGADLTDIPPAPRTHLGAWMGPALAAVSAAMIALRVVFVRARWPSVLLDVLTPLYVFVAFWFALVAMYEAGLADGAVREVIRYAPIVILLWLSVARRVRLGLATGMALLLFYTYAGAVDRSLLVTRTFFGVHRVAVDRSGRWILLSHGTTRHGLQSTDPVKALTPTMYYHPTGPIGQVFKTRENDPTFDQVAIVGLGTGGLAAYGKAGQTFTFFEIDPKVEWIAKESKLFTFLDRTPAQVTVKIGDGRVKLREAPDKLYDLIIIDAFSSDAIPIHLITREAVAEYFDKLAPGGMIAFHISNRYLDLRPVLAAIAQDLNARPGTDAVAIVRDDQDLDPKDEAEGKIDTTWVVLARRLEDAGTLAQDERWLEMQARPDAPRWTDDYSNILKVFIGWGD